MTLIGKSRLLGDFDDRATADQQVFRVFDPHIYQVFVWRPADVPAKDTNQMEGAQARNLGKLLNRNFLGKVISDVFFCPFYCRIPLHRS